MRLRYSAARLAGKSLVRILIVIRSLQTAKQLAICLERKVFLCPLVKQPWIVPKQQQGGSNLLCFWSALQGGIKTRFVLTTFWIAFVSQPLDVSIAHMETSRTHIEDVGILGLRGAGEDKHTAEIHVCATLCLD
jgi:hypothetical protein